MQAMKKPLLCLAATLLMSPWAYAQTTSSTTGTTSFNVEAEAQKLYDQSITDLAAACNSDEDCIDRKLKAISRAYNELVWNESDNSYGRRRWHHHRRYDDDGYGWNNPYRGEQQWNNGMTNPQNTATPVNNQWSDQWNNQWNNPWNNQSQLPGFDPWGSNSYGGMNGYNSYPADNYWYNNIGGSNGWGGGYNSGESWY